MHLLLLLLTLHIDGVEISAGQDTCQVSVGDRSASLIYAGLAKGVTGQRFITIAVTFRTGPRR